MKNVTKGWKSSQICWPRPPHPHWALEYGYVTINTQNTKFGKKGKKQVHLIVKGYVPKLFQTGIFQYQTKKNPSIIISLISEPSVPPPQGWFDDPPPLEPNLGKI